MFRSARCSVVNPPSCVSVQHPFVFPTTYSDIDISNSLVFVVQPFRAQGSLKDQIYQVTKKKKKIKKKQRQFPADFPRFFFAFDYQTDPQYSYVKKYQVAGKPLAERTVASFGRQILEVFRS